MARFDLANYEPVKIRKKRFYGDYPNGRIIVDAVTISADQAVFKAYLYKDCDDQDAHRPLSTGHAQEFKGQGGMANKFAWCENCEESAIGRALDNAGYASDEKCSREEMIKVQQGQKQIDALKDDLRSKVAKASAENKQKVLDELDLENLSGLGGLDASGLQRAIELLGG